MLIEYHRRMLSDRPRHAAFHKALSQVIEKGRTTVADVGSGTGILGFMASRLGAKKVYMHEQADVIALSRKLARDNKIKNLEFFHGPSSEWRDPPQADVIVSETLGNYAFEENIIDTVEDAKRFLNPGGTIIPQKIMQFAAPVTSDRFYRELLVWDDVGYGFDFSAAKAMSLNNIYVRTFKSAELLEGKAWDTVDFRRKNASTRRGRAEWEIKSPATVYGFAVWWRCELLPGIDLGTGPADPKTHWEQLYFPVLKPVATKKGDTLSVAISSATTQEAGTDIGWKISLRRAGGTTEKQALDLRSGFI